MTTLLVVHHSPGVAMPAMLEAALTGTASDGLDDVEVIVSPALETTSETVVAADGYLLATPANLGYMSGALKHFFDTTYNDALDVTRGRPFGLLVHGESDTTGAQLAVEKITTGLAWRPVADPVAVVGPVDDDVRARCIELGATVAATTLGF